MGDVLIFVVTLGIWAYAFFDCASTPQESVRRLPKWAWLLIILLFDIPGSIGWFIVGRPKRNPGQRPGRTQFVAPDDNPDFLRKL